MLDGSDVIYVARSAAKHRLMAITLSVGTRLPAAHTSMGRILLAQLSEADLDHFLSSVALEPYTDKTVTDVNELRSQIISARQQGYAISDQELDSGLRSIAVPVYDAKQHLMGAINISTNAARIDLDTLINVYLPVLQKKVAQVRAHIN
ncbi:hypothetical protein HORIV_71660 [Vreelandella olivaria]|uniref:IclR-ED domain-containing protein n=1 Tax=Vreelandella olivaria TaxID=390919 RepID=A0ABN5X6J9_9GAMM|nr:hypothetical protein HORIV_71660 [Halomonas olivaria]